MSSPRFLSFSFSVFMISPPSFNDSRFRELYQTYELIHGFSNSTREGTIYLDGDILPGMDCDLGISCLN